jgi:hypothetical protein
METFVYGTKEAVVEVRGTFIEIINDEMARSPREECDNLGTIVTWHRHEDFNDDEMNGEFPEPQDFADYQKKTPMICLPVYMLDHSGIALSTASFHDSWDSGQLGWIFVTLEQVRQEYSVKKVSQKLRKRVEGYLRNEIETLNQYVQGDIWGFRLVVDGEEEDSCWGFYGHDVKTNGMLDNIPKEYHYLLDIEPEHVCK